MVLRAACAALTAVCCVTAAAPATAQSLGDLARQEEARRTTAGKAVKSFSNADLSPSEIARPSGAASSTACYMSISQGKCVAPEELVTNSKVDAPSGHKESEWRANAEALREELARAQADYETLVGAAADESRSPGERTAAAKLVSQQRGMIERVERKWLRLQKQAEHHRVPRAWLEPIPTLSTPPPQ
jgi:hypothetical protein